MLLFSVCFIILDKTIKTLNGMKNNLATRVYNEQVELKYQLYNSLFLTLPLDGVYQTGIFLPLLAETCTNGFKKNKNPKEIIEYFFKQHPTDYTEEQKIGFLFKTIQYIERQVVLIDALEDAAYADVHALKHTDTLLKLFEKISTNEQIQRLKEILKQIKLRVVLTAHPTQFYPSEVLAIITDLSEALAQNDNLTVKELLAQLGKTPFFQKEKPTPFVEAVRLSWYLSNIFYESIGRIMNTIAQHEDLEGHLNSQLITLGFWPGGDRDGNPFVTVETTLMVADRLRRSVVSNYRQDLRIIRRRLSFRGVYEKVVELESLFTKISRSKDEYQADFQKFDALIREIEQSLIRNHQSLFLEQWQAFMRKWESFGLHFASIDIRQDSRVIKKTLDAVALEYPEFLSTDILELPEKEQIEALLKIEGAIDPDRFSDAVIRDTVASIGVMEEIQNRNGEKGAHRYIISNCRGPIDIARVLALFRLSGWLKEISVDIVPLFETIDDLEHAEVSMKKIYTNELYRKHLSYRNNKQTVMLGFSDGTKDGGYLMANWAIFRAKRAMTAVSRQNDIEIAFFDGRGGPPARGGGNAHLFYSAMGDDVENKEIQLTVQGQTISSHYGTHESSVHNLELMIKALIENNLHEEEITISAEQKQQIYELAQLGYDHYQKFKAHPLFMPYLQQRSTLKYYGQTNIGSRPSKRGKSEELKFEDLRAIPFVGAWSQLKQNVPGFYGVGTALKQMEQNGKFEIYEKLYHQSKFFRALISNSMQSMRKTNFELTKYMEHDPVFGDFWKIIYDEFELSKKMVLKLTQKAELLDDNPVSKASIALREKVVLPLLTIQQYALMKIQENPPEELLMKYEKMVVRSLFGNINASRNSA